MKDGANKLVAAIGETISTVPKIYDDVIQPSAQEVGRFAARVPRAINAAFSNLDKWIANREYSVEETKKILAKKLEKIDNKKITTPELYVAVPAIQAISYSMDSEELRELYANLLAKAMNTDTKEMVHPAFVNIISQMSPLDAQVLHYLFEQPDKDMPLLNLIASRSISSDEISYIILQTNISPISFGSIEAVSLSVENLSRNNLINISDSQHTDGYDCIIMSDNYKTFYENQCNNMPEMYPDLSLEKKNCVLSALGKAFCDICLV